HGRTNLARSSIPRQEGRLWVDAVEKVILSAIVVVSEVRSLVWPSCCVRAVAALIPQVRTSANCSPTAEMCQRTKSLRSSPLRGGRSREASSRSRGRRQQVESSVSSIYSKTARLRLSLETESNRLQNQCPLLQDTLMFDPVQAPSLRHAFELVNAAILEA